MLFSANNIQDINKYFLGTYVKFADTGETLYRIDAIKSLVINDEKVMCVVATGSNKEYVRLPLWPDQPYEVSYVLPKKGLFQHKGRTYLLQRHPARQYFKGINDGNTHVYVYNRDRWEHVQNSLDLLQAYVDKPKIEIPSIASLSSGKVFLLSRRMLLDTQSMVVLVDTQNLGIIKDGTVYVNKLFLNEVSRVLSSSDIKVEKH